jgi:outer membrane protein OmpA-like peptidoglycan-associated protein
MNDFYIPGVWAKRYEHLPAVERKDVNDEADRRFKKRTGVSRALDPNKDASLRAQWLRIRDEVMAQMAGQGSPDPRKTSNGLAFFLPTPSSSMAFLLLYNYDIGDDQPKSQHLKVLDGVIGPLIKAQLDLSLGVIGHASRTGRDGYDNQGLSDRRATQVDGYIRKIAHGAIKFFKAGGYGSKQQVSQDPTYRLAWADLESIDEDERDRSVVIMIHWQPVGIIDVFDQPDVDWGKAFDEAAKRAGLMYALKMGIKVVSDYAPSPIPGPWNPVTGWPNSWTTGSPDADAVMKEMGAMMINEIEQAARRKGLKISRDDIIGHYQEWLKDPKNKWVNP